MLSCSSKATTDFRNEELSRLEESLKNIGTPPQITEAIIYGISHWCLVQQGIETSQRAPSIRSIIRDLVLITQAYSEQTRMLGWHNFLRGRISKLWGKAVAQFKHSPPSSLSWCTKLVSITLTFTHALWTFRNGVLHGHLDAENNIKVRGRLQEEKI
jgi:hypothetical protein